MTNKHIIMLGPSKGSKGGISSVIQLYDDIGLFEKFNISFKSTFNDKSKLAKITSFVSTFIYLLIKLIRRDVSLVHIHTASRTSFFRKSLFLWLSFIFRTPVIMHIHSGEFLEFYAEVSTVKQKYIKCTLMHAKKIILLTEGWKSKFSGIIKDEKKLTVLANPVDSNLFKKTSSKKTNADKKSVVNLLFLGKVCEKKGIYDLIKAIKKVSDNNIKIQLYYGGHGEIESVKHLAKSLDIENIIHYLGWVTNSNKIQAYQNADIFILPSYHEGQPMTILEAMAAGCTIISTTVGGIPETVINNKEALLYKAGNINALANYIAQLASIPQIRLRLADAAMTRLNNSFSSDILYKNLKEIYHDTTNRQ